MFNGDGQWLLIFIHYLEIIKTHTHTHTHTHTQTHEKATEKKLWKVSKSSWKSVKKKSCDLVVNGVDTSLKLYFASIELIFKSVLAPSQLPFFHLQNEKSSLVGVENKNYPSFQNYPLKRFLQPFRSLSESSNSFKNCLFCRSMGLRIPFFDFFKIVFAISISSCFVKKDFLRRINILHGKKLNWILKQESTKSFSC